jgi:hypothetical protein
MLDLLDLSIGKSKREPTADEKLAALSRDTRRRKKILQDAWAESQRIDTVKHAKIHGLVGYEMLRRKDEQKRDVEARRGVLGIRRPRRHRRAPLVQRRALTGRPPRRIGSARSTSRGTGRWTRANSSSPWPFWAWPGTEPALSGLRMPSTRRTLMGNQA